eukprot:365865-Chlamydomonas_euryale.AAC.14
MARVAVGLLAAGAIALMYVLGGPLYYRFTADVLRPFDAGQPGGGGAPADAPAPAAVEARPPRPFMPGV